MSNRAKLRQKELKKQQERAAENRAANPEKYSTNNVITGRKNGNQRREEQKKKRDEKKQPARKSTEPCDVEKILITSAKNPGESVNLTGGMIRFMYYESLLSNTIKATYTYSDSGNTANNAKTGSNCKNTGQHWRSYLLLVVR